jgi:Cu2+-exporting ATPase
MFVFLLLAARYFELMARIKAVDAQTRIAKLAPATAVRLDRFPGPQRQEEIAAAALAPGDLVLVRAGASVPADGVVVDGASALDESLLSGESRSVPKTAGEHVVCGAINKHEPLIVRVEHVGERSLLAGIVRLMDRAQTQKPRIARIVDRVATVFVACVLVLAAACALGWYWVEPERALWVTIAVLVASCPCALSLATPAAMTAATTALYRQGVLLTRGHAIETLAQATHFVFDKTGSLTSGELTLVGVLPLGAAADEDCLRLAVALEMRSEHPLGRALVAACSQLEEQEISDWHNVVGQGIEARVAGVRHRIGRPDFVAQLHGQPLPQMLALVSDEVSVVALGNEHGWLALLTFSETLRPDARRLVSALQARGAQVCLLSGDRSARVARLAGELGIAVARAEAVPEDKLAYVRQLQRQGAVVVMIGDGVNDAPVLAQAQVSFALASGADLAHGNADAGLMGSRLGPVLSAVETAGRTLRIVRQNLLWAAVYNVVALPLAALGVLTPLGAAIGMSVSSLLVVGNALRLLPGGRQKAWGAGPGAGEMRSGPHRSAQAVRGHGLRRQGRQEELANLTRPDEDEASGLRPRWRPTAWAGE